MKKINTILIVDDNKSTLQLNKWLLEDFFPSDNIYTKTSGQEALNFIQNQIENLDQSPGFPLLIFCDVYMPGISGWELVDALYSIKEIDNDQVFVVLLSAYVQAEDAGNNCMNKNIVYMNKPLTDENVELIKNSFDLVFE